MLRYLKDLKVEIVDAVLDWLDDDSNSEDGKDDFDAKAMLTDFFAPNILVEFKEDDPAPVVRAQPHLWKYLAPLSTLLQGNLITSYRSIQAGAYIVPMADT